LKTVDERPQNVAEQALGRSIEVVDLPHGCSEPLLAPPRGVAGVGLFLSYVFNQLFGEAGHSSVLGSGVKRVSGAHRHGAPVKPRGVRVKMHRALGQ
jgi:hypothetical protein